MRLLLMASLAFAPAWAGAQIYNLLKDTPSSYFNEADQNLFWAATNKALDQGAVNETIRWENPQTRHRGDVTVLREFQSKQRPCKQLRVRNEAGGIKSDLRFDLCTVDGKWALVAPSDL